MNNKLAMNEDYRHDVKTSLLFNKNGFYIEVKYGKDDMSMISQYMNDLNKAIQIYVCIISYIISGYATQRDILTILSNTDKVIEYIRTDQCDRN